MIELNASNRAPPQGTSEPFHIAQLHRGYCPKGAEAEGARRGKGGGEMGTGIVVGQPLGEGPDARRGLAYLWPPLARHRMPP